MNAIELAAIIADEKKAFEYVEKLRWNGKPVCPHCGNDERIYVLDGIRTKKNKKNPNGKERFGLKKCGSGKCRKQFTVRVGSIFEDSPIELGKWVFAIHMMCSSKKGISANQLKRELGISYQSAWFLCHRVRLAMTQEPLASMLGSPGRIVEADEMYVGGKKKNNFHKNKTAAAGKKVGVLTLIDRKKGIAVTKKIPDSSRHTLLNIIKPIVDKSAVIVTDGLRSYEGLDKHFAGHHVVDHSKEFVRSVILHTNFAESYHSLFKRGVIGAFHHISEKHIERYLREFEFRWNTRKLSDSDRTELAIQGTGGKRLMLKEPIHQND